MDEKEKQQIIKELNRIPKNKILDYFEDKIKRYEFLMDGDITYDIFFDDHGNIENDTEMFGIRLGFKVDLTPGQAKDVIEKLKTFRMGE
jgi:hypothetical protein